MLSAGLQKLTLLDYPQHLAAVVFLPHCNFRCPFCHNKSLVLGQADFLASSVSETELLNFFKKRQGILDGVVISGGEPTLYPRLPDLIAKIRSLGYLIKLDTNGSNPDILISLCENHQLDYVAMDIKSGPSGYEKVCGISRSGSDSVSGGSSFLFEPIKKSAEYLLSGQVEYEFRTTVVKGLHSAEDFEEISQWIAGCRQYYLQSFQDSDSILCPDQTLSAFSPQQMLSFLSIVQKTIPNASLRGIDPSLLPAV